MEESIEEKAKRDAEKLWEEKLKVPFESKMNSLIKESMENFEKQILDFQKTIDQQIDKLVDNSNINNYNNNSNNNNNYNNFNKISKNNRNDIIKGNNNSNNINKINNINNNNNYFNKNNNDDNNNNKN